VSSVLLEWLLCCFGNQESISLMATIQTKQSQHNSCLPARTDHHCPATDAASGTTPSAPTSATSEDIVVTCAEGYFTAAMATCNADDTWNLPDCTGAAMTGCALRPLIRVVICVSIASSPIDTKEAHLLTCSESPMPRCHPSQLPSSHNMPMTLLPCLQPASLSSPTSSLIRCLPLCSNCV
jgi:hypothetical protein